MNIYEQCSVVMPYRPDGGRRDENLEWVLKRWNRYYGIEICVSDSPGETFSRSEARNLALSQATRDIVIVADADSFVRENVLVRAISLALTEPASWYLPFVTYLNLDDASSRGLLSSNPATEPVIRDLAWEHEIPSQNSPAAVSGVLVLQRKALEKVHGWDTRFVGWGYEDTALALALDCLWGKHKCLQGHCFHLWHPIAEKTTFDSPTIQANRDLFLRYKRAVQNTAAMENLVEEHHSWSPLPGLSRA